MATLTIKKLGKELVKTDRKFFLTAEPFPEGIIFKLVDKFTIMAECDMPSDLKNSLCNNCNMFSGDLSLEIDLSNTRTPMIARAT